MPGGQGFDSTGPSSLPTTGSHTTMMSGLDTHGHGVPRNGQPVPRMCRCWPNACATRGGIGLPLLVPCRSSPTWAWTAVFGSTKTRNSVRGSGRLERGRRGHRCRVEGDRRAAGRSTPVSVCPLLRSPLALEAPQAIRDQFVDPDFELDRGGIDGLEVFDPCPKGNEAQAEPGPQRPEAVPRSGALDRPEFGRLLSGLDARGLMDDALVIMTADHGEMLNERRLGQIYTHGPDVDCRSFTFP